MTSQKVSYGPLGRIELAFPHAVRGIGKRQEWSERGQKECVDTSLAKDSPRRFTDPNPKGKFMRSKLIAATAVIGLFSFPALAGDDHYNTRIVLMAGQIWNGNDTMTVSYFHDKPACESAWSAFEAAGKQSITTARPGSPFKPAFWHICAQVNSAMP